MRPSLIGLAGLVFLAGGCKKAPPAVTAEATPVEEVASATPTATSPAPTPAFAKSKPGIRPAGPPAELWREFSGEKAMAEVERQVSIGPRPSGSPEARQARQHIAEKLKASGWVVEEQAFTDETPRGPVAFVNVIARHPGAEGKAPSATTPRVIVCSHYDTKRFSTIRFVGASDGASSTGALLELARVLALDPALAAKVELVFFDGEEAVQQFTETDGLYGSRHYASQLAAAGRVKQYAFAILWDMIGDKDLTITLPPDSPAPLARGILESADALGLRQHFGYFDRKLLDDHVPLQVRGIMAIDLIDFDYLPWHTADDTLEKLNGESLQKVGAVTLHYLQRALPK